MLDNLNLPVKHKKTIGDFITILQDIYKDYLYSVVLYGSVASGEFSAVHSNINLIVVLNDTSLSNLSKIAPVLSKNKFRLLNVLFFTEDYIKSSASVFPIEFLDIKENYRTAYGKDFFMNLYIDSKNLRFQCEQELKSKTISIKKIYLANINNPALDKLLIKFFTSSLHILRNILRLKNKQSVYKKDEILHALAAEFHIDISNMNKMLEFKKTNKRLPRKAVIMLFNSFVNDLEKIADVVDGL